MADQGGTDGSSRLDRMEKVVQDLLEHARLADRRIDAHDRAIDTLRTVTLETNGRIGTLVSALRDLTDRIPPESLR